MAASRYHNRILVGILAAFVVVVLAIDTVARYRLTAFDLSFRAWETVYTGHRQAPFWPGIVYRGTIHGDLANLLKAAPLRQPRDQVFTADRLGYRNPVGREALRYPVVVVGDSDMAGSSLSDEQTFSTRLSELLGVPVYNYAPNGPDAVLHDPRFVHRMPKVLVWQTVERSIQARRIAELAQGDADSALAEATPQKSRLKGLPRLSEYHARWWFGTARWWLLGSPTYLNRQIAHVDPETGMMFYAPGVRSLHLDAEARNLPQVAREIAAVRDRLAARGVTLVYLPLPDKENIYRDRLPARMRPTGQGAPVLSALATGLEAADVHQVRLLPRFQARAAGADLYFKDDTHWSPHGVDVAVEATAAVVAPLLASGSE